MSRPHTPALQLDADRVQRLSRRIDHVCELMARLSGSAIPSAEFFQTLTARAISVVDGPAGSVWLRSPQGLLQQFHQTNVAVLGIDQHENGRHLHSSMLKHAVITKQLFFLEADSKIATGEGEEGGNPAPYPLVMAPILDEHTNVLGVFEVWFEADGDPKLRNVYANFINHMAGYASNYLRSNSALRNTAQEQVFTQIESFSRQIHGSLNPTEVAFLVVNEGRRLIGCDRLSAGVRLGKHTRIEAVSGSDTVERSSVQVQAMQQLFDAVLDWNERLVVRGARDPSLPPAVLQPLDDYLAQSNSKLLVVQPLRDEREQIRDKERESKPGPARSALLLEAFDPPEAVDALLDRFNLVSGHAASALYNAAEMKRIPFAFLWKPVLALQGKAGGKRRFYTYIALAALALVMLMMVVLPYPLKLDAKGQLEPDEWNYIFPTDGGRVTQFKVAPGQIIRPNTPIAVLVDHDLGRLIGERLDEIHKSEAALASLSTQATDAGLSPAKRKEKQDEMERERSNLQSHNDQLNLLLQQHNADRENPGQFTVFAPEFQRSRNSVGPASWKVVSADFVHQLSNRWVRSSDPLLHVGNTEGAWQIEMKIPQKHVSQLLRTYNSEKPNEFLEVDVLVTSAPTQTFKGRLYRRDIGAEAVQNKDDHNESELIVYAYVRINDADMPPEDHIPVKLLVTGVEVHTKIRCGDHSLGYSLFHGAWEFVYEHVVFFF